MGDMASSRRPRSSPRRLLRPSRIIGALVLVVVVLALLAIPFLKAPGHAQGARTDLEAAQAALGAGNIEDAEASVQSARRHADQMQGAVQGIGGDVWSLIPILGEPVSDVRHLGNALDDLTSVAEIAVATLPQLNGKNATLFGDRSVDLDTLDSVVTAVTDASDHLDTAQLELAQVNDSVIGIGTTLAEARDDAARVVNPLASGARRADPLVRAMPAVFGADGEQNYLLALLNPSEQRYSGGAPLTLAPLRVSDGQLSVGKAEDTSDEILYRRTRWEPVDGNIFHRGKKRLSTATYAPDWTVSGEELLRGWAKLRGQETDGLIAVDVVALNDLLRITGPVDVPIYGRVDSSNFTQKIIGDYDAFPDNQARHDLNLALVPLFTDRLFSPGEAVEKLTSLRDSARGRHFALWMRDPDAQAAVAGIDLDGTLADTDHDYLAVFNQNTNESKADYWQRRSVTSDVRLRADGSARVQLRISVQNDSPPYTQDFADPRGGTSVTRWNGMALGAFLPRGATVVSATSDGKSMGTNTVDYFGRPYKILRLTVPPTETREAMVEYDVPAAADARGDGALIYRLAITPQGLVTPQAVSVTVHWPEGFDVSDLPEGWERTGPGQAVYNNAALVTQPSFTLTGAPESAAGP